MKEAKQEGKKKPLMQKVHPLMSLEERLEVWPGVREMWKGRRPNPITELEKMRADGERDFPSLHN